MVRGHKILHSKFELISLPNLKPSTMKHCLTWAFYNNIKLWGKIHTEKDQVNFGSKNSNQAKVLNRLWRRVGEVFLRHRWWASANRDLAAWRTSDQYIHPPPSDHHKVQINLWDLFSPGFWWGQLQRGGRKQWRETRSTVYSVYSKVQGYWKGCDITTKGQIPRAPGEIPRRR